MYLWSRSYRYASYVPEKGCDVKVVMASLSYAFMKKRSGIMIYLSYGSEVVLFILLEMSVVHPYNCVLVNTMHIFLLLRGSFKIVV